MVEHEKIKERNMITKKKKTLAYFGRANGRFDGLSERECDIHIEIEKDNT